MRTGAVITAAGMSSRMGDFKPLMKIGSISMIERIVSTFKTTGIDLIVVVTGNQACKIEKAMKQSGVVFLNNENYETTDMFASAKIGLEYLKDKCDQYLITPVDIPLFMSDTVLKLINSGKSVCCPQYDSKTGHPLILSKSIIQKVLSYDGSDGLRGAINSLECKTDIIDVDDKGILFDADTMEDYKNIVEIHNKQLLRPLVKLSIAKQKVFFDPLSYQLLMQIEYTGSVIQACTNINMSYSKAWNIINALETEMDKTFVIRQKGGSGGGNAQLTSDAKNFVSKYMQMQNEINGFAQEIFNKYFS